MNKIPELRAKVLAQAANNKLGQYVWKYGAGPQMGYSFSVIHALAYSFIGAQTLYLATNWEPIYWNTACLIVNSGAVDPEAGGQTDYSKIAKALGEIINAGIHISLTDINKSEFGFKPDAANNQILYGMKAMLNVGDDVITRTIANRPYISPKDFYYKVRPNKQAMISLIKGGAFDNMLDRKLCMGWFLWEVCDKKNKLTLQNMAKIIRLDLVPSIGAENKAKRIYEFNRFLKQECKNQLEYYIIPDMAYNFLSEMEVNYGSIGTNGGRTVITLEKNYWDKCYYQPAADVLRAWVNNNQEQLLRQVNEQAFLEEWNKYALGNISSWEMEALCFYYHDHELKHIDLSWYGLSDFARLPEEPIIDTIKRWGGREIPLYKLHRICGTCIAKNKSKSTVSLLTTSGVVTVKFRKEYFSMFDKQISQRGEDGVKHTVDKSWFNRGSMIIVTGIRRGGNFIAKRYAATPWHQLYKIEKINGQELSLTYRRKTGEEEESDE